MVRNAATPRVSNHEAVMREIRMRAQAKFSCAFGLACPTGKSVIWLSSPCAKNISLAPSGKSVALARPVSRHRGALANVINAGKDAVDAEALLDERRRCGRRSRVVLTPRRWRQVCERQLSQATVAKEPDRRGEHEGSR